jgi:hypothetical protein
MAFNSHFLLSSMSFHLLIVSYSQPLPSSPHLASGSPVGTSSLNFTLLLSVGAHLALTPSLEHSFLSGCCTPTTHLKSSTGSPLLQEHNWSFSFIPPQYYVFTSFSYCLHTKIISDTTLCKSPPLLWGLVQPPSLISFTHELK